jgi:ribosomal protein S12 methylthiotransferase
LEKIEGLEWIRILYCYPENLTDELIEEMRVNKKVCHYLDMPIQHASDPVLKRMARRMTQAMLKEKIAKLRAAIPDITLRTTLIIGFPGETEADFENLCEFIKEIRFDRLGVFTYSQEEDTPAAQFMDQIPEEIKHQRKDIIMALQHDIAVTLNQEKVGQVMKVLIEGKLADEEDVYMARSYQDAPEIDGQVFIPFEGELLSGDFVTVKIVEASEYDLIGEIVDEYCE